MTAIVANTGTLVAFGYGSKILSGRIRKRYPSATALGIAELRGHELRWHKRSRDGSGKCNVVKAADTMSVVYGVLYEISVDEVPALDKVEGLGSGYKKVNEQVVFRGTPRIASNYHATDVDPVLKPYIWYKALVIAGANEHCLPVKYIEQLAATGAIEDLDRERNSYNWRLMTADREGR